MKKILGFISGSYLYLLAAKAIFAADVPIVLKPPAGSIKEDVPFEKLPQFIVTLLFVLGIIFAISYLVYGGIRWVMSKGDKTKVEEARNHIVAALVGLVIVAAAFFFVNGIFFFLTGHTFDLSSLCIPNLTNPNCK